MTVRNRSLGIGDVLARRGRLTPPAGPYALPRHHAAIVPLDDRPVEPPLPEGPLRDAAVLLALVERDGETRLILTRRTDHLKAHSGQVALPGGKIDDGDATPVAAALREAQEEIGLAPETVAPIGLLPPYVTNSGYRIFPVVAEVAGAPQLVANPFEVAEIFEVPLGFLMDPANHVFEDRVWHGIAHRAVAILYGRHRIWGVTGGILRLFHDEVFR